MDVAPITTFYLVQAPTFYLVLVATFYLVLVSDTELLTL